MMQAKIICVSHDGSMPEAGGKPQACAHVYNGAEN